jgi:hypothetical protein
MIPKVAVFQKKQVIPDNFYQFSCYEIVEKNENGYQLSEKIEYQKISPPSTVQIRKDVNELIRRLRDCKVVAFQYIAGIPYSAFDRAGFKIFQITDNNEEIWHGIFEDLLDFDRREKEKEEIEKKAVPVETDIPGIYYLDMIKVQENNPEISTKKVLIPFFESSPFMELRMKCVHIPPWIEKDAKLKIESEKTDSGYLVVIRHKQC